MFELFLTYWFSWILFIIIIFFVDKNKLRFLLLICLLLIIILFPIKVTIFTTQVYIVNLVLFIFSIIFFVYKKVTFYRIVSTFTMVLGYIGLLFWEKTSPIWFFLPSFIIVSIWIVMMAIILQKGIYLQFTSVLLSVLFAQIIYDIFLKVYLFYDVLSNDSILIIVTSCLLLFVMYVFREGLKKVFQY